MTRFLLIAALMLAAGREAVGLHHGDTRRDSTNPPVGTPYIELAEDVQFDEIDRAELFVQRPTLCQHSHVERLHDDERPTAVTASGRSNGTRAPPASSA